MQLRARSGIRHVTAEISQVSTVICQVTSEIRQVTVEICQSTAGIRQVTVRFEVGRHGTEVGAGNNRPAMSETWSERAKSGQARRWRAKAVPKERSRRLNLMLFVGVFSRRSGVFSGGLGVSGKPIYR